MWVKDYMFNKISTVSKDVNIKEAVKEMVDEKTNSLIVVDKNLKPIGILSSYTLIRNVVPAYLKDDPIFSNFGAEGTFDRYAEKMKNKKVKDIMHTDFHILSKEDTMIEAASYSIKASRRILPVVCKDGKLIGAITRTCIKNALYNALYKDNQINPKNGGC
ncbi:MAG: CBS domain-containing protein [Candidatus Falkowbacteria bacterium]